MIEVDEKVDDSSRKKCRKTRRRILMNPKRRQLHNMTYDHNDSVAYDPCGWPLGQCLALGITLKTHELGDFWLGSPVLRP